MLKISAAVIAPHLTRFINSSFTLSTFPSSWKLAKILPLSKTNRPTSPSETRPIALLPELSKIEERFAYKQLITYLENYSLLHPMQTCYRKGHSTQTALLHLTTAIRKAIDDRMVTVLVMFDFSKAFDTIPHKQLLLKLRKLNFSDNALKWLFSYLHDRKQAVIKSDGSTTAWLPCSSGVPQGSILGPLLFAIYINDLPEVLRYSKVIMYAHDTQIYLHCLPQDIISTLARIEEDAQEIANWAVRNGLSLNESKIKVMVIGSSQYIAQLAIDSLPCISINGKSIAFTSEAKNLGITITSTLNWKPHIQQITRKVYSSLISLNFHRHALNHSLRTQLVQTLILPHFDYASCVFTSLDKSCTKILQTAHNSCIRFIFRKIPIIPTLDIASHVTHHRLSLKWLSLCSRRHLNLITLAYRTITSRSPTYLIDLFPNPQPPINSSRPIRTPPASFHFHSSRTEAWRSSFPMISMSIFNKLGITDFEQQRFHEFRKWFFQLLLLLEISDWSSCAQLKSFHSLHLLAKLPFPSLPFNYASFSFTSSFLATPGYSPSFPFPNSSMFSHP